MSVYRPHTLALKSRPARRTPHATVPTAFYHNNRASPSHLPHRPEPSRCACVMLLAHLSMTYYVLLPPRTTIRPKSIVTSDVTSSGLEHLKHLQHPLEHLEHPVEHLDHLN